LEVVRLFDDCEISGIIIMIVKERMLICPFQIDEIYVPLQKGDAQTTINI